MKNLLWVDCTGAFIGGCLMLFLSSFLQDLYSLPLQLLVTIATVNLLYGSYSFSLAVRARRRPVMIAILVFANAAWAITCFSLAVLYRGEASVFGLIQLIAEGLYVGFLAVLEWRSRALLSNP